MKKLGLVALFGLVIGASANAEAACGTFEVAKGDIKVQSAGKVVPVSTGGKICAGDTVIAGPDSRAKIKMADGNELNVSPDSKIVIEDYQYNQDANKKKVLLNILKGKVRATTREENMYNDKAKDGQANTFQIRTKSAVAGVRGTDFLTSYDPSTNKTGIVTFKGKVEFGQPGANGEIRNSVQVGAGQRTDLTAGQAPEPPKPVPPSELKNLNSETKADTGSSTKTPTDGVSTDKKEDKKDEAKTEEKKVDDKKADGRGSSEDVRQDDKKGAKQGDDKKADGRGNSEGVRQDDKKGDGRSGDKNAGGGSGTGSGPSAGTGTGPGGSGDTAGSTKPPQPTTPTGERQPAAVQDCAGCLLPPPPPPPAMPIVSSCPGGFCAPPPVPTPFVAPTPPPAALNGPAKVNITINVQ